jgi:hypothetical protein
MIKAYGVGVQCLNSKLDYPAEDAGNEIRFGFESWCSDVN